MAGVKLVILADDLTGALDATGPFAARGLTCVVATGGGALGRALAQDADIVAVNTASRDLTKTDARRAIADLRPMLPGGVRLFKKIDSRLKGHIAAELQELRAGPMLVMPAIPAFGRIVADGQLGGHGVDTPIAVRGVLGRLAPLADIPDCRSDADMDAALADAGGRLLVGARGLAEALARAMTGQIDPAPPPPLRGPVTIVVGSRDPITMAQVDRLSAMGIVPVAAPNGAAPPARGCPAVTVVQAVAGGNAVNGTDVGAALATSLMAGYVTGRGALVLTGGATAEAVLAGIGIDLLHVRGEILDGLPLSEAGTLQIVTKSGGFGDAETLIRLAVQATG